MGGLNTKNIWFFITPHKTSSKTSVRRATGQTSSMLHKPLTHVVDVTQPYGDSKLLFASDLLSNKSHSLLSPNTKGQLDQSWNSPFMLWFQELDVTLWFKFHQHVRAKIKGPSTCCARRPALGSEYLSNLKTMRFNHLRERSLILTLHRSVSGPSEVFGTGGETIRLSAYYEERLRTFPSI